MSDVIKFEKRTKEFKPQNFIEAYRSLPKEKQQRTVTMLLGFFTRQAMECGIDDEKVLKIYELLDAAYQDMLISLLNEQLFNS